MRTSKRTAHLAGVLYLLLAIGGFYSMMIVPGAMIVRGDAAATAHNIATGEFTFRLGLFSGLASNVLFLFLGLVLYELFESVSRSQVRLLVALVLVEVLLGVFSLSFEAAPLVLLSGADFLSPFTKPQLDALAYSFLRLHGTGIQFAMAFWGLWLFPFGFLVIRSRFFPRILGWLLYVNGVAYLVVCGAGILFPARADAVNKVMLPFYSVGELATILWLLVMGAKVPQEAPAAS